MTVISGYIDSFEEAARLAFDQAQAGDMKAEAATVFAATLDPGISREEVAKLVATDIKWAYGKEAGWHIEEWWQVPVPLPRYDARDLPCLVVEGAVYAVSRVKVSRGWRRSSWHVSVVAAAGKLSKTVLPLSFLTASPDEILQRYSRVGKDGAWTLWQMMERKQPLRLHDDFLGQLHRILQLKDVAGWLDDFGARGRRTMPLVVGSLLGMMYQAAYNALPLEQQPATHEGLVATITGMGYGTAQATRALQRAGPELTPDMTLGEAIPIVLKYIAEGE